MYLSPSFTVQDSISFLHCIGLYVHHSLYRTLPPSFTYRIISPSFTVQDPISFLHCARLYLLYFFVQDSISFILFTGLYLLHSPLHHFRISFLQNSLLMCGSFPLCLLPPFSSIYHMRSFMFLHTEIIFVLSIVSSFLELIFTVL
jgi:hypothetical protein